MRCSRLGYAAMGLALVAGSAQAGGFSRGIADTDILYEEGNFNFRAGAVIVSPSHKFSASASNPDIVGTDYLDNYMIPSAAVKFGITENLACTGTFTTPFGAASSYADAYGPSGKRSEDFTVSEFGATCAVFVNVGRGRLAVLGGAFVEKFDYSLSAQPTLPGVGSAPLDVDLDSNAYGWRAGVGYEIPDIAFRAQLMYRSGTTHDATGSGTLAGVIPVDTTGYGELPQSVEFKLQTGIAPGWLAFGSVLWTDWSVNETLDLSVMTGVPGVGTVDSLNQYYWRDGWTITGGVGHAFTDNVSGLISLQWDRGVATGYDPRGEKWLLAGAVNMSDVVGGELRLGAGVVYLASADIDRPDAIHYGDSFDSGWAGILSASFKLNW